METSSAPLIVFYRVCSTCETRVLRSVDIQVESRAIAKQTLESRSNISILHATHARHHDRQIYIDCRVTACWHSDEGRFVTLLPAVETGLQLQKGCRSARLHTVCPFSCVRALARSVKMCSRALCPRQTGDTNTGLSRLSLTIIAGTSPPPPSFYEGTTRRRFSFPPFQRIRRCSGVARAEHVTITTT